MGELVERGDLNTWVWCGRCGAAAWGVPPHGEGNPCPFFVERHEHEIEGIDANRRYWDKMAETPSAADLVKRSFWR